MGVCERCRKLCPSTIIRQGDEALCDVCETYQVRTLEAEHQQRKTRSALRSAGSTASTPGCTSGPPAAADESTSAVSISQEAQQPGPDASYVTATSHPTDVTTQPHGKVDQAAADAQGPLSPAVSWHCNSQCKVGRTGEDDMIRCCLCFRWHHEQCITDGSAMKDTLWWICTPCRSLPLAMSALSVTLVQMRDNMSQILETNNALMKSIKHLSIENDVLKSQRAYLSDEVNKVINSKKSPKPPTTDQSERS